MDLHMGKAWKENHTCKGIPIWHIWQEWMGMTLEDRSNLLVWTAKSLLCNLQGQFDGITVDLTPDFSRPLQFPKIKFQAEAGSVE